MGSAVEAMEFYNKTEPDHQTLRYRECFLLEDDEEAMEFYNKTEHTLPTYVANHTDKGMP
ncbi:hypothetical protein Tsubulata_020118 [Turnera subulata]|uniref:Uncharacterized protein n=1 Tax=Turnera subulata TaxID=218843 RepID=A0A9Q0F7S2_9ROSI|nr:hypothetical protein Tsubulata_020118 [Turnera subulata]